MSAAGLLDRADFERVAEIALGATSADDVFVALRARRGGTTRFANNQITQNVNTQRATLAVSVAFGKRSGRATTTELTAPAIRDCVARAEAIARVAPDDPEYLPPLPPQQYPVLPTHRHETAAAGPERLRAGAAIAIDKCDAAQLNAAGIISAYESVVGLAANTGLRAFERRTTSEFSLTATGADSSGWVRNQRRSIDDLDVETLTDTAIRKAQLSAHPREIPAGKMRVILEPAAVCGFVGPLWWSLDARRYFRQTSAVAGKLGQRIIDSRLSMRNAPHHPALLGNSFNGFGLPTDSHTWIEHGVLGRLNYDRFTAKEHGQPPSYSPDAILLEGDQPAADSVEELIAQTDRAVLVTNFWYIRSVNPRDLTHTGMTRDGTFLVEGGAIVAGLVNFRWHESPLRALNTLEAFTPPGDAITMERPKMLLPALRLGEFNFSSVTKF
ncbi:MAG: hypothetical protein D6744_01300 [Planctomycetota bacterium]|nr:MAG: hypothetical protein D6744_01300 [Planctomycetota bacterium]